MKISIADHLLEEDFGELCSIIVYKVMCCNGVAVSVKNIGYG